MTQAMERLTIEEDGSVRVPARLLRDQGLEAGSELVAEGAGDGQVLLHRPDRYDIEIYTDERIAEFEQEGRMSADEEARIEAVLAKLRG